MAAVLICAQFGALSAAGKSGSVSDFISQAKAGPAAEAARPAPANADAVKDYARAFVSGQEKVFSGLYHTCGYGSEAELVRAINEQGAAARSVLEMISGEKYELSILVPEKHRDSVAKKGFLNWHQTGTSSTDDGSTSIRIKGESLFTLRSIEEYKGTDPSFRPKYGFLNARPGQVLKPHMVDELLRYGEDNFIFKTDRVRDRTTFTIGDSLTEALIKPYPYPPADWNHLFIPFAPAENRTLMVPPLVPGSKRHPVPVFQPLRLKYSSEEALGNYKFWFDPDQYHSPTGNCFFGSCYIELQYWGPVDLDDVEILEFHGTPPSGAFLAELTRRGIAIRDGRGGGK